MRYLIVLFIVSLLIYLTPSNVLTTIDWTKLAIFSNTTIIFVVVVVGLITIWILGRKR